jgi:glycolate oxidase iron-sulfur subunit
MTQNALHTPTSFPLAQRAYDRALDCVHCGLCLPTCPTYATNGLEADSPRGRIYLMKALADGRIEPGHSVVKHLGLCLDCRACETACPSGVVYHELIEETRSVLTSLPQAAPRKPHPASRIVNWLVLHVFPWPWRIKLAILPARIMQKLRLWGPITRSAAKVLPAQLEKMQQLLPITGPLWPRRLAKRYPATRPGKLTVGFFGGCVGQAMFQQTNRHAIDLLTHFGCDVVVPRSQRCCGAIHHHAGDAAGAVKLAKRNIKAFADCDLIVTDIAGCGAMLKDYEFLLHDQDDWATKGRAFSSRVRDINELLVELDPPIPPHAVRRRVTYHDACHLAHGQGITSAPRKLLAMIEGLTVVPLNESDMCCGAAGTYNIAEPQMSRELARRKLANIRETGCDICVMSNVGCAMQIDSEARRAGMPLQVVHPVDLLHEAYFAGK